MDSPVLPGYANQITSRCGKTFLVILSLEENASFYFSGGPTTPIASWNRLGGD